MTINLSVVGCGKIGTSIGLALKDQNQVIHRTGFDRFPPNSKKAFDKNNNEINDIKNLVALCPNHHCEFDNKILKL